MKRWIHASESGTVLDAIVSTFSASNPGPGCSFIDSTGKFINIYPKLDVHEDLCEWVKDNLSVKLPYVDDEYFVREFGWVRLRSDPSMCIVEMPAKNPANSVWYALEDWFLFVEERNPNTVVNIEVCDSKKAPISLTLGTEYFGEDVVKILKRYYSSGTLVASTLLRSQRKFSN